VRSCNDLDLEGQQGNMDLKEPIPIMGNRKKNDLGEENQQQSFRGEGSESWYQKENETAQRGNTFHN